MSYSNDGFPDLLGSAEDTKAVEHMLSYTVINANDKELMARLFPTQSYLLEKLKQFGYTPEKIRDMCSKEKDIAARLFGIGLEFKSFKEAGVKPSSIIGMKYQAYYQGYLHQGPLIDTEVHVSDLIPNFGFTVEELVQDGIKERDIPPEYLIKAGYSLEKMKELGTEFRINKRSFSLDRLVENYDLKRLCHGGIDVKGLTEKFSCAQLYEAGYSPRALQSAGFSAKDLRDLGVPAKKLRRGFRFYDLSQDRIVQGALYSVEELKLAGYNPSELKEAGISAKDMKRVGYSRKDLECAFTNKHLNTIYR